MDITNEKGEICQLYMATTICTEVSQYASALWGDSIWRCEYNITLRSFMQSVKISVTGLTLRTTQNHTEELPINDKASKNVTLKNDAGNEYILCVLI